MSSGLEIQGELRAFLRRWRNYAGSERGEAQTFLNQLFECYGTDRLGSGARFEDAHSSTGIMDLYWRGVCIIEMKAPARAAKLVEHRKQALDYWRESSDVERGIEAPPYVVLCAFQRFEIWMPGRFPTRPVVEFSLDELPDRYDALMFLSGVGVQASFLDHHRTLTTEATRGVSDLYHRLADRSGGSGGRAAAVRPRDGDRNTRKPRRERWWQFARRQSACELHCAPFADTSSLQRPESGSSWRGRNLMFARATSPTSLPSRTTTRWAC